MKYEFRHPEQTFQFSAHDDLTAQEIWFCGLLIKPVEARKTQLIRLKDGADITPVSYHENANPAH